MNDSLAENPEGASTFVLEYAAAHWRWEVWAFRLWLADGDRPNDLTWAQIQDSYDDLFTDKIRGRFEFLR